MTLPNNLIKVVAILSPQVSLLTLLHDNLDD